MRKNQCYDLVAGQTADPSVCDKISGETEFSHDSCLNDIAYETKDASICEESFNSASQKDRCYYLVNYEKK